MEIWKGNLVVLLLVNMSDELSIENYSIPKYVVINQRVNKKTETPTCCLLPKKQ
ncbi:hypothetical protein [Dapis sp. BLCC M172]|uniref:hypothetical protein n=1 Tax=Dapis sp. BLCC M172 TaxID=2975281 RepID=UPI003CF4C91F